MHESGVRRQVSDKGSGHGRQKKQSTRYGSKQYGKSVLCKSLKAGWVCEGQWKIKHRKGLAMESLVYLLQNSILIPWAIRSY